MNVEPNPDVLKLLQNHRSIRKFRDQKISDPDLVNIITSAQAAPSSSHGQSYSIIGVTDPIRKKKLAEYAGSQPQVESCSHFLVFCADLYRLEKIALQQGVNMTAAIESTEMFMVATIDAALVAQNAAIAAEALGLGIVYTGGLRNHPYEVAQLLELPKRVYPVFGMCIGYPGEIPDQKPRLPLEAIYFENKYKRFEEVNKHLHQYDEIMRAYYLNRTHGIRSETWSETMTNKRKRPRRMNMKSFLSEQGFPLA
ncbi:oxygen-insensitive NADPH nitroreductase [Paenibacillus naphthalenovorans]|uniref:oxygen-insensitive NADPH nitroreductase n=1 Tax=Paenibacillus naphthalenovorans TaxID=162209 RepID=UPI00088D30AF|nr:oxygen-insensitive NADPH nitroreductase [Paenibacillus naphthalenovorans]SDI83490.1 FMN reductase (NADPH) [Paenibacillus naphthalenovorans]